MKEELKGAAGVVVFGFAIAAIVWILPIGTAGDRFLAAKRTSPVESPPPSVRPSEQMSTATPFLKSQSDTAREAPTGSASLHVSCQQRGSDDPAPGLVVSVANSSGAFCDGVRLELRAESDSANKFQLPPGCTLRGLGDESVSCELPDLDVGASHVRTLPITIDDNSLNSYRIRAFAWCGDRAIVASTDCESFDEQAIPGSNP